MNEFSNLEVNLSVTDLLLKDWFSNVSILYIVLSYICTSTI